MSLRRQSQRLAGWGRLGVRAAIAAEIAAARQLTGRPIAVNLLLPFVRPGDVDAAATADVVVTFWGKPRRLAATTWIHQCETLDEAKAAAHVGADAVIVQGGQVRRQPASGSPLRARPRKGLDPRFPEGPVPIGAIQRFRALNGSGSPVP